jgi:ABC-type antimicrobial peptide transport system permease subunit
MRLLAMTARTALRALRRNKLRSALTMLGVVIGVGAVIVMVSIGQGASEAVRAQIESLGTNLLMVVPGATTSAGVRSGAGGVSTLTLQDAKAIAVECSSVSNVSWMKRQIGQVIQGERNWSTQIQGVSPAYFSVRDWHVDAGDSFGPRDDETANRVALLGKTVVENLFGRGEDPVGATIRIKDVPFRVVGVLERKGQTSWGQDQDDTVVIPFATAERRVLGSEILGTVDMVFVSATRPEDVELATEQIGSLLRQRHRIAQGADDDFTVRNLNEMAVAQESAGRVMAMLLLCVASISLLVGGIGIMNILLVSVTERTREIGIRMAVGARRQHILLQFLVEAVVLSGAGGVIGVVLGIAAAAAISAFAGWPTLISGFAVVGALLFSATVGVFFGFWPARRAAGLDPIAALRYE